MTIIAAAVSGQRIAIASDSQGSNGHFCENMGPKVHAVAPGLLVGWSGSYLVGRWVRSEMAGLLRFATYEEVNLADGDAVERWLWQAWDHWLDECRARGRAQSEPDGHQHTPGTILVATVGGLFQCDSAGAVHRHEDGFAAIGSGREVAVGAMYALLDAGPAQLVGAAVAAAVRFVATCGGSAYILTGGCSDK